jgi:hypothetical protein
MKAQSCGCIPVTSGQPLSAAPETCGDFDLGASGRAGYIGQDAEWQQDYVRALLAAATRPAGELAAIRARMKESARRRFSWRAVAAQWTSIFRNATPVAAAAAAAVAEAREATTTTPPSPRPSPSPPTPSPRPSRTPPSPSRKPPSPRPSPPTPSPRPSPPTPSRKPGWKSVLLEVGLDPTTAGAGSEEASAADAAGGASGSGGRRRESEAADEVSEEEVEEVEEEAAEEAEEDALVRRMAELRAELDRQHGRRMLLQQRTSAAEVQLKACEEDAAAQSLYAS